ncbi:hypothetical protein QQ045_026715 [Rhodiola kirilowii]
MAKPHFTLTSSFQLILLWTCVVLFSQGVASRMFKTEDSTHVFAKEPRSSNPNYDTPTKDFDLGHQNFHTKKPHPVYPPGHHQNSHKMPQEPDPDPPSLTKITQDLSHQGYYNVAVEPAHVCPDFHQIELEHDPNQPDHVCPDLHQIALEHDPNRPKSHATTISAKELDP